MHAAVFDLDTLMKLISLSGAVLLLLVPALVAQNPVPAQPQHPAPQGHPQGKSQDGKLPAKPMPVKSIEGYAPGASSDGQLVLKDLHGKEHKLADFQGKVTVVDFWSITCPISRGWETRLKAIAAEYAKKDVNFLAINSNRNEYGEVDKITAYVEMTKVPYTILLDDKNVAADAFGATHTPHVFVLDAKGVVKYVGAVDDDQSGKKVTQEYLRAALDALIAGKDPATTKTQAKGCSIKRVVAEQPKAPVEPKPAGKIDPKKGGDGN